MSLLHVGLDVGSTTAKAVILDADDQMIHSHYRRHFADISSAVRELMGEIRENYGGSMITMAVAGSGAISLAEGMQVSFAQELIACSASIGRYLSDIDVCIELGGEDAKLTFFDRAGADQRMNETCAGGTGAFLDQMAALLGTDASGLNELAKGYKTIYPIASRCGVFAKTDIQPLLNDGAAKRDIAASIFQAIVNQTISGLACGRKIAGNVAFLGGPLYFLSELRARFAETLSLSPEQCVFPENPHLFVAIGAAILGKKSGPVDIAALQEKAVKFFSSGRPERINVLPMLFEDQASRESFRRRHSESGVERRPLAEYSGDAFLGIDVGSTTTKVVLVGCGGEILFSRYRVTGGGEPLLAVREILLELYEAMPDGVRICRSGVTGYGEKLVQTAMGIDVGEVETVVHARAAEFVLPGVDFVIDIGGQDMKCLGVKNGVVRRVFLNEACSSGCGSFLQSLAESLEMDPDEFASAAEESTMPVDLGSRCTVFMNSRVRQAQKEGASVRDISAGLAYSVVHNALYKVLKLRDSDELGERIVAQGGTFKNDALLRAFELSTGRCVVRPEISELMGAFGAALTARDTYDGQAGTTIGKEALQNFRSKTSTLRCGGCGNRCILTRTLFRDGKSFVSGNRCERGASWGRGAQKNPKKTLPPNIFERKYKRLFDHYKPLPPTAPLGVIGIPRVLNMYENYPLWFTLFTNLGFRVEVSSAVPPENMGIDTIPSQTLCYPAKLAHRHIADLLSRGVKRIFYPIVLMERREFADAHQHFNCPVITGYPDAAFLNIDDLRNEDVTFLRPPMPIDSPKKMPGALAELLKPFGVSKGKIKTAIDAAYDEMRAFKEDIASYGRQAIESLGNETIGIVLAGHPYHLDPEVNHGIPELINSYGAAVFTEDSICGMAEDIDETDPLYVVDQWVYHSRLYRAASVIAKHPSFRNAQMVQLNSFGCGLDAISADQAADLLERHGKLHTLIKIDEGKNNGAVKIRIRSLLAAAKMGSAMGKNSSARPPEAQKPKPQRVGTALRDAPRTILCPPLSTHHFQFLETAMRAAGLNFEVLPEGDRKTAELALKHVNNDACYPSMVVIGQFLEALESGRYDPETTDCLYAQTGGACRASNYVPLLRRALDSAGFRQVRVLAANAQGNSGAERFSAPIGTIWRSLLGLLYGDLLMRLSLRTRPYETEPGSADRLYAKWALRCNENMILGNWRRYVSDVAAIVSDFAALPIDPAPRPRVGIVGEILVKYHANANEKLVEIIESEGGEAVVPDLAGFISYCLYDPVFANMKLSGKFLPRIAGQAGISALEFMKRPITKALAGTRFGEIHNVYDMAELAGSAVSPANQAGEGWLLSAEMMRLIESGVRNILCIQPFACLPNHITGKGVMKELKRRYKGANILALDYDISVSNVNQINRIKLLMASARVG